MPPSDSTPAPVHGDAEIARLLHERDGRGLCLLLEQHGDRARGGLVKCFRGSLSDSEIDDALSTATFKAWRAAKTYDANKGSLRAWFFVIARNAGLEILRERQRRAWEVRGDEIEQLADRAEPDYEIPRAFLSTLRQCIARLPRMQRRIIEADLASGDVADAGELAETLRTSKNSVYVSRSTARKALKQALIEQGYAPDGTGNELLWK